MRCRERKNILRETNNHSVRIFVGIEQRAQKNSFRSTSCYKRIFCINELDRWTKMKNWLKSQHRVSVVWSSSTRLVVEQGHAVHVGDFPSLFYRVGLFFSAPFLPSPNTALSYASRFLPSLRVRLLACSPPITAHVSSCQPSLPIPSVNLWSRSVTTGHLIKPINGGAAFCFLTQLADISGNFTYMNRWERG
jgi:hypothetical protein